jgi:hypothetical protein
MRANRIKKLRNFYRVYASRALFSAEHSRLRTFSFGPCPYKSIKAVDPLIRTPLMM